MMFVCFFSFVVVVVFLYIEKIKTVVSSVYLWVVFTLLSVYSLAVVTLIVKKVINLTK